MRSAQNTRTQTIDNMSWDRHKHTGKPGSKKPFWSFLLYEQQRAIQNVSSADPRLNLITTVNPKGTIPHIYIFETTHTDADTQIHLHLLNQTACNKALHGLWRNASPEYGHRPDRTCSPLTFRSLSTNWTTRYGSESHKASNLTWCEGRRMWGETERGEIPGEQVQCLAGEAWDGKWQANTELVGRSQISLCVWKWPLMEFLNKALAGDCRWLKHPWL